VRLRIAELAACGKPGSDRDGKWRGVRLGRAWFGPGTRPRIVAGADVVIR
jgi:hypothetical protein